MFQKKYFLSFMGAQLKISKFCKNTPGDYKMDQSSDHPSLIIHDWCYQLSCKQQFKWVSQGHRPLATKREKPNQCPIRDEA